MSSTDGSNGITSSTRNTESMNSLNNGVEQSSRTFGSNSISSGNSTSDVVGRTGGVRGMIFGNDSLSHNSDGSITKTRKGGIQGLAKGSTSTTYNSKGQRVQSVHKPRLSTLRGSEITKFNPKTQQPIQTVHKDSSIKKNKNVERKKS